MRRILAVAVAGLLGLGLLACEPQPAPTITATPSTLTPGCDTITTVTGKVTPKGALTNVAIQIQGGDGKWTAFEWFPTGASGEPKQAIKGTTKTDGTYSLTYYRPHVSTKTQRLRVLGKAKLSDPGVPSKSWYVTNACTG